MACRRDAPARRPPEASVDHAVPQASPAQHGDGRRRGGLLVLLDGDDGDRARCRSTILVPAVPRLAVALATTPETIQLTISLYSRRPRDLAACARPAVRSLRPPARGPRRPRPDGGRELRRHRRKQHRRPDRRALSCRRSAPPPGRSSAARSSAICSPRARRLHAGARHHRDGGGADGGAAHRRHARHAVRLEGDLRLHRRWSASACWSGRSWRCRRRTANSRATPAGINLMMEVKRPRDQRELAGYVLALGARIAAVLTFRRRRTARCHHDDGPHIG